jgi:hypothetical protein
LKHPAVEQQMVRVPLLVFHFDLMARARDLPRRSVKGNFHSDASSMSD